MVVFGEICHWMKLYFPLERVRLLNKWKCTDECYLCLLAQLLFSFFFPLHPPALSCRPCPVRVWNVITWLKGKTVLRICLLRTQFVMFASFKGAIDVGFFLGSECALRRPVASTVLAKTQRFELAWILAQFLWSRNFSAQQNWAVTLTLGEHWSCKTHG